MSQAPPTPPTTPTDQTPPGQVDHLLRTPGALRDALAARVAAQDARRGDWPSPRDARQPHPPWPAGDDLLLDFLVHRAEADLAAGDDPRAALVSLAVHAWFEGGVEAYDRGRRDAG